ncbi:MAG TPA: PQQ-like beta-propeller repeat protein [Hyphomonadaceae bacterium]|nr:PQQ-like beta-propeller repeat protein [Hyphomonadaceae bacterium]
MRSLLLALPMAAILAACGNAPVVLSEEEKAARVTVNPLSENLTPDPALASATIALPAVEPSADWPQAGVNSAKHPANYAAGSQFKIDWRVGVGEGSGELKRIVAAPVARDGRIYTIDANQRVTATDIASGKRIWENKLKAANPKWDEYTVGAGLAITGDKLIVASGFAYVTALSLADGKEVWHRRVESPLSSSPAILGNRAFLTSTNNDFYAIDTDDGEIIWNDQALSESARVLSSPSPAVTQDILAVGYSSGELIAYLPANGRRLWTDTLTATGRYTPLSAINDIAGKPTIQDGVVYVASHSGILAAIDSRSGARLWSRVFGSRQGPVIGGNYLFVVGTNAKIAAFNRIDGKIAWVRDLPEFKDNNQENRIVWTGPLMADGRLIITSSYGDVLALSPQNGETVAELTVGQGVLIEPIAAGGKIFLLTDQAQLIAIK